MSAPFAYQRLWDRLSVVGRPRTTLKTLPRPQTPAASEAGSLVMVGISNRNVPPELFARLCVPGKGLSAALTEIISGGEVLGAVLLSTCNRTEIYASCRHFHGGVAELADFFGRRAGLKAADVAKHLFFLHDDAALGHLFNVASGLESAVLGETEILGQVQRALSAAEAQGVATPLLARAFRSAVGVGRRARSETGVARGSTSLTSIAVARSADHLGSLQGRKALIIGAGAMGRAAALALTRAGSARVTVLSRSLATAEALANELGGHAVASGQLSEVLRDADVVVTATSEPGHVVDRDLLSAAMLRRPERRLVVVDLARPANVDPGVGSIRGVKLLGLRDLETAAAAGAAERGRHVQQARRIVAVEVERFLQETAAREIAPLVSALRCQVEEVRRAELLRWQARMGPVDPQVLALAEAVTSAVVAKLLHTPSIRLKNAAGTPAGHRYGDTLAALFDLNSGPPLQRLARPKDAA